MTVQSPRAARAIVAVLSLGMLAGCQARREQQGCRMEREVVIGNAGGVPKSVDVVRESTGGYLAAWSADGETFVAGLDPSSLRVTWVQRVERFALPTAGEVDGGTAKTFWPDGSRSSPDSEELSAVALEGGGAAVAMLERPAGALPGGAFVALVGDGLAPDVTVLQVGPAWPFASRIDVAAHGGRLFVAWHEGQPDASRVRLAALDLAGAKVAKQGVIPGDRALSGPVLAAGPNGLAVAWTRTDNRDGTPRSEVRAASLSPDLTLGRSGVVAVCRYLDPAPHLIALGERFGLAYRDDADDDDKPEFYFAVLDARGRVVEGPARISRADGFQGPSLAAGDRLVFSAAVRSFQRNYLVGLNRFDLAGVKRGGEFQIYADKSDFVRVALAAHGNEVLLVYGEDRRGRGRVLASRVICRDNDEGRPSP